MSRIEALSLANLVVHPRASALQISLLLIAFLLAVPISSLARPVPQTDQEALFSEAVDAYNHNLFTQAQSKFQQVTGAHAPDAQQYMSKIKAYQDAIGLAKSAIERNPDEQDAKNMEYAIQQLQLAIKVKPDGPWNPNEMLNRARELKAQVEKTHADRSKAMATEYCSKAVDAIKAHHYKVAAQFICAVANDNPGYSCGGDEAVHMCGVNTDLAKLDKTPASGEQEPLAHDSNSQSAGLDQAKAAYDKNDFERARRFFQSANGEAKPEADQYLDKISRYTDAIANAEKASRDGQYEQARTAFLRAATIKPDGPGDPQIRASAMELYLGLDRFYAGDYGAAIQQLQSCARAGLQKQPLVHFYLGASELGKFLVTGSEDSTLQQAALNDLKQAKQAGFKAVGHDVSPKILQVYNDLAF